jgi:hypothetical protein
MLAVDQMLAGPALHQTVEVPGALLPNQTAQNGPPTLVLRPLAVRDIQQINRAARDDDALSASLMIQQAVVEPALKADDVAQLPAGLATFLIDRINAISGITASRDQLDEMVQAPLARACFVLAKEFGWTPEQVSSMSIGQILLYLEMSRREGERK